ncbi:FAD binding domain-containing protein [Colletotrichum sp. SAR 10_96]|nr:FAD binding domain-containing protein [Colletotrichum sp. SAR 10_96]
MYKPSANNVSTMSVVALGVGPVGSSIAVRLAHTGIKVYVIEKNDVVDSSPRAAGCFGRLLIALQRTNIFEKANPIGFSADGMCWRQPIIADEEGSMAMSRILDRFDFLKEGTSAATGHVSSLYLPQSRLPQLLLDEAISTVLVEIHITSVLKNILQDDESVTAIFSRSNTNSEKALQAVFLVGSDRGRSPTRRILDVPFKGHTWAERLVAIDCLFQMPPGADNTTTSFMHLT